MIYGANVVRLQAFHRAPPQQPTMSVVKPEGDRDRRAVWDQVGLSYCRHDGLVTVRNEARLRCGHNDQSRQGHQCSETMLTGEFWFHISTPLGIEPWSLMTGSNWVVHWTVRHGVNAVRLQALHKQLFKKADWTEHLWNEVCLRHAIWTKLC